jgi:hypothetical protein
MKTIYPLLCTAALLGPGAPLSFATDPVAPATGKVLIVDERHTMEGDIERVADQYRIRHGGGETWLPANKALRLCADNEEALAYLRTQANLEDADEHLRLALWCRDRNLPAEALAEVRRAVELRPNDAATKALLTRLESDIHTAPAAKPGPAALSEPPAPPLAVDLTAQSMGQFITHVQPILMNSCASCHANSRTSSSFRLMHAADLGSRKATQQNLAAVLAQVNLAQPQASPFLSKALGVHGEMAQAPFKNREAAAFRTLDNWVTSTVAANPRLREVLPPSPAPTPAVPLGPVSFGESRPAQTTSIVEPPFRTVLAPTNPTPNSPLAGPSDGASPPQVAGPSASRPASQAEGPLPDAYDPDEFNRVYHPQPQAPVAPQPQTPVPVAPVQPGVR